MVRLGMPQKNDCLWIIGLFLQCNMYLIYNSIEIDYNNVDNKYLFVLIVFIILYTRNSNM